MLVAGVFIDDSPQNEESADFRIIESDVEVLPLYARMRLARLTRA
jgi:hypothetical protein